MPPRPRSRRTPQEASREFERRSASGYLRFPDAPFPHSILLVFKSYSHVQNREVGNLGLNLAGVFNNRTSGVGRRVSQASMNSVELPFPKQLQDNTSLRINSFERDPLTENIARRVNDYLNGADATTVGDIPGMIQGMGAGMSQMMSASSMGAAGGALNDIASRFLGTNIRDVATAAQYLLRKNLPGDIGRTIDNVTGQTLNPRETLAFEGVQLRTHQFNWDLFPSNQQDSERIKEIIAMIKKNSLPGVTDIAGVSKAFLQYPSVVDVYLIGVNRDHWMKYKTSMVTSFTVDYGAGGTLAMMKGGKPAGVNLSLQMTELEIETNVDYGGTASTQTMQPLSTTQPPPAPSVNSGGPGFRPGQ